MLQEQHAMGLLRVAAATCRITILFHTLAVLTRPVSDRVGIMKHVPVTASNSNNAGAFCTVTALQLVANG